jgi:GDP-mannose 6-dehydrogenase
MMAQGYKAAGIAMPLLSAQSVISILGIDATTAAQASALLEAGFNVICADADPEKVEALSRQIERAAQSGLRGLGRGCASSALRVTDDPLMAIIDSDVTVICQGASENFLGETDSYVLSAMGRTIGAALAHKAGFHVIIQQAATEPGTTRGVLLPAIEAASGLRAGVDFGLCHMSDRLEVEADAAADDLHPVMLGVTDARTARHLDVIFTAIGMQATVSTLEVSEMTSSLPSRSRAFPWAGKPAAQSDYSAGRHMLFPLKGAFAKPA